MSNFYFCYGGNKRRDIKFFKDYIKLDDVETIIEPFCGSCAFSYYCFTKLNFNKFFEMNDIDEYLINFLNNIKNKTSSIFNEIIDFLKKNNELINNDKNFFSKYMHNNKDHSTFLNYWLYKAYIRKVGTITPFYKNNKINVSEKIIKKFFESRQKLDLFFCNKNINYTCNDYILTFEKFKNDKNAFLFLDPPYLSSDNSYYYSFGGQTEDKTEDNFIFDHTKIYIDIMNFLKICKCKVLLIINKNAINEYIFNEFVKGEYIKIYQLTKKKTYHLIISNY